MITLTPFAKNWPVSIPGMDALVKAYPPLEHAHTVMLWDADTFLKRMPNEGESKTDIPAGARWITVHPGGDKSAKGQPILVIPHPHKHGVYSVIGGAGGKLNYLKIRGLKSDQDYKDDARQRAATQKELEKERISRDKESGLHVAKSAKKDEIDSDVHEQERQFINHVAKIAGWSAEETEFPAEDYQKLSPAAYQKMQKKHHQDLLRKASEFIDLHQQSILADRDRKAEALGAVPLTVSPDKPEQLSVDDLNPVKPADSGRGFSPDYRARAEQAAGDAKSLQDDIEQHKDADQTPEEKAKKEEQAKKRKDQAEQLKEEIEAQTEPPLPDIDLEKSQLDVKQILDLLAAKKQLRALKKQAGEKKKKIDEAKTLDETKAYNLTLGKRPDAAEIAQDLQDRERTQQTISFLDKIKNAGEERHLTRHINTGAAAAANSAGIVLGGQPLVDRSVIDVLGTAGAAQVIARQLHASLSREELDNALDAIERYHVDHYTKRAEEAMQQADAWSEIADMDSPDADEITDGHSIAAVEELNRKRIESLAESRRILGTTLGEFEMHAALIMALKEGRTGRNFETTLGAISVESAVTQLRALGLDVTDFTLDKIGGQQIATISPEGMDRIARPVDREAMDRTRAAQSIIDGHEDEDGWLPDGVARRPDLAIQAKPGQAQKLALPYDHDNPDSLQALKDYIGGRTADGDAPADIYTDLINGDFAKSEDILIAIPVYTVTKKINEETGKERSIRKYASPESFSTVFNQYADEFVQRQYGGSRSALHKQSLTLDDKTADAMHRALSAHPEGVAAYKAIGDLTPQDQRTLRKFFETHVGASSASLKELRQDMAEIDRKEPEKYKKQKQKEKEQAFDMFGGLLEDEPDPEQVLQDKLKKLEQVPEEKRNQTWMAEHVVTQRKLEETRDAKELDRQTPEWKTWNKDKQEKQREIDRHGLDWNRYVDLMGRKRAYQTVQDLIKSHVNQSFLHAYNTLHPEAPLKTGRAAVRHHLDHLSALDPDEREKQLALLRSEQAKLRERADGKFAAGSVKEKQTEQKANTEGLLATQKDMFGNPIDDAAEDAPLKPHQIHTLGHTVEQQMAGLASSIGSNFKPGQSPVNLFNVGMSGKYVNQQRAIKLILKNKRIGLAQGVGSGKSLISLGAFAHLHANGSVKKGIFCVPSIVQDQMHAEALRFLKPGQFKWFNGTGASREERIAALKDPENHFSIMTHQSLRDDLLYLGAQHAGMTEAELAAHLEVRSPEERSAWMKELLDREGINADYLMMDEGHSLLNRQGKENSAMANVLDALGAHATHYVNATADPVKNDASEAFSVLEKMNPDKYHDRAEFMRRYGPDTQAAREGLRREMLQHMYPGRIDPGVAAKKTEHRVDLTEEQDAAIADLEKTVGALKISRLQGKVNIDAAKKLAPHLFADAPESDHEKIAKEVAKTAGILKNTAVKSIIDRHPNGAKQRAVHQIVADHHGQPGIIFCHSLDAVKQLSEQLQAKGHRVVSMTGADSAEEKGKKKARFNPEKGQEATADIMVTSDAGAVGMNAQRGRWLVQYDTPDTAMVHNQRNGRIHRLGQTNNVHLIDIVANHPHEANARRRLASKEDLRELMTSPYEGLDDTGLAHYLHHRKVEEGSLF